METRHPDPLGSFANPVPRCLLVPAATEPISCYYNLHSKGSTHGTKHDLDATEMLHHVTHVPDDVLHSPRAVPKLPRGSDGCTGGAGGCTPLPTSASQLHPDSAPCNTGLSQPWGLLSILHGLGRPICKAAQVELQMLCAWCCQSYQSPCPALCPRQTAARLQCNIHYNITTGHTHNKTEFNSSSHLSFTASCTSETG